MILYSKFNDQDFGGTDTCYPLKSSAEITVDGVVNVIGKLAGLITANNNNGILSIDTSATLSLSSIEGNSGSTSATEALAGATIGISSWEFVQVYKADEKAEGKIGSDSISTFQKNFYLSTNKIWNVFEKTFKINYFSIDDNGTISPYSSSNPSSATAKDGLILSDPTSKLNQSTFVGWYFDGECTKEVLNNKVLGSQLLNYSIINNGEYSINIYSRWTTGSTVKVKYYDSYNSSAYPSLGSSFDKMSGQTITIAKSLQQYKVIDSSKNTLTVYTFEKWQAYYNDVLIENSLTPGSTYKIPDNVNSGELIIKPYYSSVLYYNITLSGSYTSFVSLSGVYESNSKYWAMEGSTITVSVTGKTTSILGYLKTNYTITATMSGALFSDATPSVSATGETETKKKEFIMPNQAVTLSTSQKKA